MREVTKLIGVSFLFAFVSCSTTKQSATPVVDRMPVKFDFSPPTRELIGASNLTIALIKPTFVDKNGTQPQYLASPFDEMATSMSNDFEELLTAKGFTIRGPFGSRDAMVYNDKINSSFAVEINIDLNSSQYNRKTYKYYSGMGTLIAPTYMISGDVILGGDLIITASSPQYGEKIWKKNITLNKMTFSYQGSIKWSEFPTLAAELKQDNVVYNAFAKQMEKYYQQAFDLLWQQIDVTEMKSISVQAIKADKDRKGN